MAGLKCALILLLGVVAAKAQVSGGSCGSTAEGALVPNGNSCGGYFICSGGELMSYQCPTNQGFNPETQTCTQGYGCGNQINDQPVWGYPENDYPENSGIPVDVVPVNGYPMNGYPENGYPEYGYPVNGYPVNGYPVNGYPIEGYPGYPIEGYPSYGEPAYGYPGNEYPEFV